MKKILTYNKIKKEILKYIKNKDNYLITIGIYTFEGENNIGEQTILIDINNEYEIQVTEYEKQQQDYKINKELENESLLIYNKLKDQCFNLNDIIIKTVSY